MRLHTTLMSLALLAAVASSALAAAPRTAPALKLEDCTLRPMFGTRTAEAKCGSWSVAEDPAAWPAVTVEAGPIAPTWIATCPPAAL